MATTHDCLFIGMQPSGLIAAALLAKRGFRVGVIGHQEDASTYNERTWRFPYTPKLIPNLSDSASVERVHQELKSPSPFQQGEPRTQFQTILPRHRFDITASRTALLAEIERELPGKASIAEEFFNELDKLQTEISSFLDHLPPLPPYSLIEQFTQRRWWTSYTHLHAPFTQSPLFLLIEPHPALAALLLSPLSFFGHLAQEKLSLLHAARLLFHSYNGLIEFSAPLHGITPPLIDEAKTHGATIYENAYATDLTVHRKRIAECKTDHGEIITSPWIIENSNRNLETLFQDPKWATRYHNSLQPKPPSFAQLTINILVDKDVIPEGMAKTLFLVNDNYVEPNASMHEPPIVLRRLEALHAVPDQKKTQHWASSTEQELLSAACIAPIDLMSDSTELASLKEQLLARIEKLVPFLAQFIELTSVPLSTVDTSTSPNAWNIHPIYLEHPKMHLGLIPNGIRTGLKNLLRGGSEIIPGLGLEGEYITAQGIADKVTKQLLKSKKET